MKINEKNLYTFANSKPVDKEGVLQAAGCVKSDFITKNFFTFNFAVFMLQGFLQFKREIKFQKRWFVLKGNMLFYFDKKGDKEPLGLLLLEGCELQSSKIFDFRV